MTADPQRTAGRQDIDTVMAILDAAGKQALGMFDRIDQRRIREKSPGDLVSDADRALEIALCERLRLAFPGDGLCGEELGGRPAGTYWTIDPIDGTSNFLSGLPLWCISIARMKGDVPHLGGIHAPALGLSAAGGPGIGFEVRGTTVLADGPPRPCFGARTGFGPISGLHRIRPSTWRRDRQRNAQPMPEPLPFMCPGIHQTRRFAA